MPRIDLSDILDLRELVELLRSVSAMNDPQEVQREFSARMQIVSQNDAYLGLSVRGLDTGHYKITRCMLTHEDMHANPVDPWKQWNALPSHKGGWLGEQVTTIEPRLYHDFYLKNDPVLGDLLANFGSALVCPLFDDGVALNWGILLKKSPDGFTPTDVRETILRGNLIGRITRNLVMRREVESLNRRLASQLEQIATIQMSLLPRSTPNAHGIQIATSYLTSNEAGGDYYDFFDMGGGSMGVLVADVSGHGAGAATVMAMLQAILHSYEERGEGPAAMLTHANHQLLNKRIESNFVTAFLGVIDADRRTITYANAGHHPPRRRLPDGTLEIMNGGHSVPLGVVDDIPFEQSQTEIVRGETLVLYTDGIVEAFSPPPDKEMFGVERLDEALRHCTGEPPCVVESIHERLYLHTNSRGREDDQTIVAMKIGA